MIFGKIQKSSKFLIFFEKKCEFDQILLIFTLFFHFFHFFCHFLKRQLMRAPDRRTAHYEVFAKIEKQIVKMSRI